jgi:hypothetical protein
MRLLASISLIAATFVLLPSQSWAFDQEAALHQALGSPDPLYKFSAGALDVGVKTCASNDPRHAGSYVALVLRSGRTDADAIAPSLVRAAIEGLGSDLRPAYIASIVAAAVNATPSEVLDIVTAAVKASPRDAAPAIVTAAVSNVPHPESIVTVNVQRRSERIAGSDKQLDDKQLAPVEKELTLAEAIVQAALDADPGLSGSGLTAAADSGLNYSFSGNRPTFLTNVLAPVVPVLPVGPASNVGTTNQFGAPGPVSP